MSTKTESRIIALLALNTANHRESALANRNLIENAIAGEKLNIEIAQELNVLDRYTSLVNNIAPRLFYEVK